jgi:cell division topological specificity factor
MRTAMNWLNIFRLNQKSTASVAKERLQVVVAHQRRNRELGNFLPRLQQDILEVIRRYVTVGDDAIRIDIERDGEIEVLELNIVLPEGSAVRN